MVGKLVILPLRYSYTPLKIVLTSHLPDAEDNVPAFTITFAVWDFRFKILLTTINIFFKIYTSSNNTDYQPLNFSLLLLFFFITLVCVLYCLTLFPKKLWSLTRITGIVLDTLFLIYASNSILSALFYYH